MRNRSPVQPSRLPFIIPQPRKQLVHITQVLRVPLRRHFGVEHRAIDGIAEYLFAHRRAGAARTQSVRINKFRLGNVLTGQQRVRRRGRVGCAVLAYALDQ